MTEAGRAILARFDLVKWQYRDEYVNLYSMDLPEVQGLYECVCALERAVERSRAATHVSPHSAPSDEAGSAWCT